MTLSGKVQKFKMREFEIATPEPGSGCEPANSMNYEYVYAIAAETRASLFTPVYISLGTRFDDVRRRAAAHNFHLALLKMNSCFAQRFRAAGYRSNLILEKLHRTVSNRRERLVYGVYRPRLPCSLLSRDSP